MRGHALGRDIFRGRTAVGVVAFLAICTIALTVTARVVVQDHQAFKAESSSKLFSAPIVASPVAFISDSYGAGAGASSASRGFLPVAARYFDWSFDNISYGGTGYTTGGTEGCGRSTCPSYGERLPAVVKLDPTTVVVSGGRNDVTATRAVAASRIDEFYRQLRQKLPNAQIIAVSPLWDSSQPPAELSVLAKQVEDGVKSVGGHYVNLGQPLSGHPELISKDGVHPNDLGYARLATVLEQALSS